MEAKRSNVLVICTDHWPGPLLGAAGKKDVYTPTVDQFCRNGIRFSNAYTEAPTCIPARRALMTGTSARIHGDRIHDGILPMPDGIPTLAEVFSDAGYQTGAVGKLHVYPQRDRIGFDEALICEEGRGTGEDDYELYLRDAGFPGRAYSHGMGTNDYIVRPWHLPEECHPTFWTTMQTCRMIKRRDPRKPGFWFCSYIAPHPPITPPQQYLDMYRDVDIDPPVISSWSEDPNAMPFAVRYRHDKISPPRGPNAEIVARKGFYAQCTYIDHQIRLLVGTLRQEGLLDDTIIIFTSDHGDMLGNHQIWSKWLLYDYSAKVPLILIPHKAGLDRLGHDLVDDRLCHLRDIMPTLLELCEIPSPESVAGKPLFDTDHRDHLYCEHSTDVWASRMVRNNRYKLIYYPYGNRFQLFDLVEDSSECTDLSGDPGHVDIEADLRRELKRRLYGSDLEWLSDGTFVGVSEPGFSPYWNKALSGQRGW